MFIDHVQCQVMRSGLLGGLILATVACESVDGYGYPEELHPLFERADLDYSQRVCVAGVMTDMLEPETIDAIGRSQSDNTEVTFTFGNDDQPDFDDPYATDQEKFERLRSLLTGETLQRAFGNNAAANVVGLAAVIINLETDCAVQFGRT